MIDRAAQQRPLDARRRVHARPGPGPCSPRATPGRTAGDDPLEHPAVAVEQRVLVAVARQAAVDVLHADAPALRAHARDRLAGIAAVAQQDRDRARAQQVARASARRRAAGCDRRSASASSPSRANAVMCACMRSRSSASPCWTSTGSSRDEVARGGERAAEPPRGLPLGVAHASAPTSRPSPTAWRSRRQRRGRRGSSPRGRPRRAAPRGCGTGSAGWRSGTGASGRRAPSATATVIGHGRRGSAPSRSPCDSNVAGSPVPSAGCSRVAGDLHASQDAAKAVTPSSRSSGDDATRRGDRRDQPRGGRLWLLGTQHRAQRDGAARARALGPVRDEPRAGRRSSSRAIRARAPARASRRCSTIRSCDAVSIATPPSTHFALVKQALEAGKHVLVEKPLATNVADAESLVELADAPRAWC